MEFNNDNTYFSVEKHSGNILKNSDHFHNLYEFYYLTEGNATYLINDKIYNMVKGDIVVIPPNTLHKTTFLDDRKRTRILIYLDKRFLTDKFGSNLELPQIPALYHSTENLRINRIFYELYDEFNTHKNHIYTESLLCELIILLERSNSNKINYKNNELPEIINSVLNYIATNYSKSITLKEVSDIFYVNSSYLSRIFKYHTGFTFCNYVNQYRIKEANTLLVNSDMSITEIAFECGFNSSNNFCKCYKKIMGTSPLSYRKNSV